MFSNRGQKSLHVLGLPCDFCESKTKEIIDWKWTLPASITNTYQLAGGVNAKGFFLLLYSIAL